MNLSAKTPSTSKSTSDSTVNSTENHIVLHISGPDKPGITSTVVDIVAGENAELIDIGQSVLHGYLSLSAIVNISPGSDTLRKILFAVGRLGLRLEVSTYLEAHSSTSASGSAASLPQTLCVTLLGALHDGKAAARLTSFLAENKMNIREITTLSEGRLGGIELVVDLPPNESSTARPEISKNLRGLILNLAQQMTVDIAVQHDDIYRRHKRLVCLDVDSTFIDAEIIDELGKRAGCGKQIAQITERAMLGELDFKSALRERVALLKGLKYSEAQEILSTLRLMPGAEQMVSTLKNLGLRVGLVSGGFDFVVEHLKQRFNLDFVFANQLEVSGGLLTGGLTGSIVDAERKAQVLKDMAQVYGCRMEQTVAVGDGANDILMLQSAGLGIAFKAKAKLQEVADLSLNQHGLDSLLFLMGFSKRDIVLIKKM